MKDWASLLCTPKHPFLRHCKHHIYLKSSSLKYKVQNNRALLHAALGLAPSGMHDGA